MFNIKCDTIRKLLIQKHKEIADKELLIIAK